VKGLEEIRSRHQAHFAPAGVEWKISNDFDEEVHAVVAIVNG
jgi:hypothetical protein